MINDNNKINQSNLEEIMQIVNFFIEANCKFNKNLLFKLLGNIIRINYDKIQDYNIINTIVNKEILL